MEKRKVLREIQKLIEGLKAEISLLETDVKAVLQIVEEDQFIPSAMGESVITHLHSIEMIQGECRTAYNSLNLAEAIPDTITKLRNLVLQEEQKILEEENIADRLGIFLRMHSKKPGVEELLQKHRDELEQLMSAGLEQEEYRQAIQKYLVFVAMYEETNPGKLVQYIQCLTNLFEVDLIAQAVYEKKDFYISTCQSESAEEGGTQGDTEEEIAAKVLPQIQPNVQTDHVEERLLVEEKEESHVEEENVAPSGYEWMKNAGALILEQDILTVFSGKKEGLPFYAKQFNSDIGRSSQRKNIFVYLELGFGYSPELVCEDDKKISKSRQECQALYNLGYLKKYVIDGMGEMYYPSFRGGKAFETEKSARFLGIKQRKWPKTEGEVSANWVMIRLLAQAAWMHFKTRGEQTENRKILKNKISANSFHLIRSIGIDVYYYTGIITNNPDECNHYFLEMKEIIVRMKLTHMVIFGIDGESAQKVERAIRKAFDEQLTETEVICYGLENEKGSETAENDPGENLFSDEPDVEEKEEMREESAGEEVSTEENTKLADEEINAPETEEIAVTAEILDQNSMKEMVTQINQDGQFRKMTREERRQILKDCYDMICDRKIYCATAFLKAVCNQNNEMEPYYEKLAYAVNDPMAVCTYTSDTVLHVYLRDDSALDGDSAAFPYFMISAILRNYFMDSYDYYNLDSLNTTVQNSDVISHNQPLGEVLFELLKFKKNNNIRSGIDKYADYRRQDAVSREENLKKTMKSATEYYENFVKGKQAENASHKRFLETRRLVFSPNEELAIYLKAVMDSERDYLPLLKEYLLKNFIREGTGISHENIDDEKIDAFMDKYWNKAGENMRIAKKTSDLMGSFKGNLHQQISKVVKLLCVWVDLTESASDESDYGVTYYKKIRDPLISNMRSAIQILQEESGTTDGEELAESAGRIVLQETLLELCARLDGSYRDTLNKYFYIDFLKNDQVLLNEEFLPDLSMEIMELPKWSKQECIKRHAKMPGMDFKDRVRAIFSGGDDYGSAERIMEYLQEVEGVDLSEEYDFNTSIEYARMATEKKNEDFNEGLELAQSYGQIESISGEDRKDQIQQIVNSLYRETVKTKNYGYYVKLQEAFLEKIKEDAKSRRDSLKKQLDAVEKTEKTKPYLEKIDQMLDQGNYTVAEDLLNRIGNDDMESDAVFALNDYLQEFLDSYDYHYKQVSDTGKKVSTLIEINARASKDTKGGRKLAEQWLTNGSPYNAQKLRDFLTTLGFHVEKVEARDKIADKIENYRVKLKRPGDGRKSNYKHPIAAFGSEAVRDGFRVICLYGTYDTDRLIATFSEVGNAMHTLVLLDYPLASNERKRLAQRTKAEVSGKIFAVIDRVVLMFLMNHYVETSVSRMLMQITMPYTYYQPYVVKSGQPMTPEIFIGRKEELEKIEDVNGVNIVYGGRQLGKSALLNRARADINMDENGDRAVLIDIKDMDYKEAAKSVSKELSAEKIFTRELITEDWDELAEELRKDLCNAKPRIPYLLLMLDEADRFIESCEEVNYHPLDALKRVQQIGDVRFKFVIAGLRNIVRFKRNAALGNNSVLPHLSSLTVKPFRVAEAKELLEIPLFYMGFRFNRESDSLVSMILTSANYFPVLIQLYCAKLLETMKKGDYAGYNPNTTPPYIVQERHIRKVLSDADFLQEVREKFMVTLRLGGDDYYYIIAVIMAYMHYTENREKGYTAKEILIFGRSYGISKIERLSEEEIEALMEEMRELNVFRMAGRGRYLFALDRFLKLMGSKDALDEELAKYMED